MNDTSKNSQQHALYFSLAPLSNISTRTLSAELSEPHLQHKLWLMAYGVVSASIYSLTRMKEHGKELP